MYDFLSKTKNHTVFSVRMLPIRHSLLEAIPDIMPAILKKLSILAFIRRQLLDPFPCTGDVQLTAYFCIRLPLLQNFINDHQLRIVVAVLLF